MGRPKADPDNPKSADAVAKDLKENPATVAEITREELHALAPDTVKVKVLWLDEPANNPGNGRKGLPYFVGLNGQGQSFPPGEPVIMPKAWAEILQNSGRFSVQFL